MARRCYVKRAKSAEGRIRGACGLSSELQKRLSRGMSQISIISARLNTGGDLSREGWDSMFLAEYITAIYTSVVSN